MLRELSPTQPSVLLAEDDGEVHDAPRMSAVWDRLGATGPPTDSRRGSRMMRPRLPRYEALARLLAIAVAAGVMSCGGSAPPATAAHVPSNAREIKVSLFGVDCADCANDVVIELKKDGPVYDSKFDKNRVVLDLRVAPSIRPEQVMAAARRAGFRAELGDGGGAYLAEEKIPEGADASTPVTDGHDVADLKTILAPGKITVVDFYADWCGPCREVDKHVKQMLPKRTDVAYRRLNVVDWDSPIGAHYLKNVSALPYVLVFDAAGTQVDAISGLDLARVDAALAKAKP